MNHERFGRCHVIVIQLSPEFKGNRISISNLQLSTKQHSVGVLTTAVQEARDPKCPFSLIYAKLCLTKQPRDLMTCLHS